MLKQPEGPEGLRALRRLLWGDAPTQIVQWVGDCCEVTITKGGQGLWGH